MKARNSPNLYEILRAATGTPPPIPDGATATATPPPVQARVESPTVTPVPAPAAPGSEKAPAPAPALDSRIETEVAPPRRHVIPAPPPAPRLTPAIAPAPATPRPTPAPASPAARFRLPDFGIGEGHVKISRNNALFALLAVGVLVLGAFIVGVRTGRGHATPPSASPAASPTSDARKFAVQLLERRGRTASERTAAEAELQALRRELERAGHRSVKVLKLGSEPDFRYVLLAGEYASAEGPDIQAALAKLRTVKIGRDAREPNFARTTAIVALPQ